MSMIYERRSVSARTAYQISPMIVDTYADSVCQQSLGDREHEVGGNSAFGLGCIFHILPHLSFVQPQLTAHDVGAPGRRHGPHPHDTICRIRLAGESICDGCEDHAELSMMAMWSNGWRNSSAGSHTVTARRRGHPSMTSQLLHARDVAPDSGQISGEGAVQVTAADQPSDHQFLMNPPQTSCDLPDRSPSVQKLCGQSSSGSYSSHGLQRGSHPPRAWPRSAGITMGGLAY